MRNKHGDQFDSFISQKLRPVAGDIGMEDLGIQETHLKDVIVKEVNTIVDVSATIQFDERYVRAITFESVTNLIFRTFVYLESNSATKKWYIQT